MWNIGDRLIHMVIYFISPFKTHVYIFELFLNSFYRQSYSQSKTRSSKKGWKIRFWQIGASGKSEYIWNNPKINVSLERTNIIELETYLEQKKWSTRIYLIAVFLFLSLLKNVLQFVHITNGVEWFVAIIAQYYIAIITIHDMVLLLCCIYIGPTIDMECRTWHVVYYWSRQMGVIYYDKPVGQPPTFRVYCGIIYPWCPRLLLSLLIFFLWTTATCFFFLFQSIQYLSESSHASEICLWK